MIWSVDFCQCLYSSCLFNTLDWRPLQLNPSDVDLMINSQIALEMTDEHMKCKYLKNIYVAPIYAVHLRYQFNYSRNHPSTFLYRKETKMS